ncbi:hypothetical protein BJX68DRAFT_265571 [Aspergillus pseudodeflectus]|uniref:Uncharacterized protein n=1 Tax=Aspergillus pseudodeflectus TaxID=176178 RepID=A0ABR4KKY7_9EURO
MPASKSQVRPATTDGEHQTILDKLPTLCHSPKQLADNSYPVGPPTTPKPQTPRPSSNDDVYYYYDSDSDIKPKRTVLSLKCTLTSGSLHLVAIDPLAHKLVIDEIFDDVLGLGSLDLNACAEAARKALYKVIDQETILLLHAGHEDLELLGVVHGRVVDVQILTGGEGLGSSGSNLQAQLFEIRTMLLRFLKQG